MYLLTFAYIYETDSTVGFQREELDGGGMEWESFIISLFVLLYVFIFLNLFLIGGKLLYNAVLIPVIQQHKSAIIIHIMGFPGSTSGKELSCQSRTHNERQVEFLGQEDPPEQGMATHYGEFHRQRSLACYSL